jgi:hypothetical protein
MTYGSSLIDAFRHLGTYTGLVLSGAKPADLPVMQTIKVELAQPKNSEDARPHIPSAAARPPCTGDVLFRQACGLRSPGGYLIAEF